MHPIGADEEGARAAGEVGEVGGEGVRGGVGYRDQALGPLNRGELG